MEVENEERADKDIHIRSNESSAREGPHLAAME